MLRYILRRVLAAALTLFIAATLTFFIMNAVPGDPFASERATTAAAKAAMQAKYGLDLPLTQRYLNYMNSLLHGDMGVSYVQVKNKPVADLIATAFPVSARLGAIAICASIIVGIPLGCISAMYRGKWVDSVMRVLSTLGIAVPGFVVATTLMVVFAAGLKWLPATGLKSSASYIMPVITLALYPACYIARLMRSSLLDTISQDYIRTLRAKGISRTCIVFKHALRNALIPVITYFGPMVASILTGGIIAEHVFNIPGLGRYFVKSIESRDYTIIMATTIFYAFMLIAMTTLCDILYKVVDPRISLEK
ncbi:peptide ABC transporter permease [Clostridia bacterium]|nr:peptide ABC transporter permease [Clostridia bacterium]